MYPCLSCLTQPPFVYGFTFGLYVNDVLQAKCRILGTVTRAIHGMAKFQLSDSHKSNKQSLLSLFSPLRPPARLRRSGGSLRCKNIFLKKHDVASL